MNIHGEHMGSTCQKEYSHHRLNQMPRFIITSYEPIPKAHLLEFRLSFPQEEPCHSFCHLWYHILQVKRFPSMPFPPAPGVPRLPWRQFPTGDHQIPWPNDPADPIIASATMPLGSALLGGYSNSSVNSSAMSVCVQARSAAPGTPPWPSPDPFFQIFLFLLKARHFAPGIWFNDRPLVAAFTPEAASSCRKSSQRPECEREIKFVGVRDKQVEKKNKHL